VAVTLGDVVELRVRRDGTTWTLTAVIMQAQDPSGEIRNSTTLTRVLTPAQQANIEAFLTAHVLGRLNR